jgi:hypothetical protein
VGATGGWHINHMAVHTLHSQHQRLRRTMRHAAQSSLEATTHYETRRGGPARMINAGQRH